VSRRAQPIFGPDLSQWREPFVSNIIFNISKINLKNIEGKKLGRGALKALLK
jgi:hypothetical protein